MEQLEQFSPLLAEVCTTHQRGVLVKTLQHALDLSYDRSQTVAEVLKSELPFDHADILLDIANAKKINLSTAVQAQKFFTDLIQTLNELPIVDLTLAFHPSYDQLKRIATWWRKETDPYILLNIKLDKNLLAGAMIGYQGVMQNLTLSKVLSSLSTKG